MKEKWKKPSRVFSITALLCLVVLFVLTLFREISSSQKRTFTRDMLTVLKNFDGGNLDSTSSDIYVQSIFKAIDAASVAKCWKDQNGKYVDSWGNEFLISEKRVGEEKVIVVRSRGEDSAAGTEDDIVIELGPVSLKPRAAWSYHL